MFATVTYVITIRHYLLPYIIWDDYKLSREDQELPLLNWIFHSMYKIKELCFFRDGLVMEKITRDERIHARIPPMHLYIGQVIYTWLQIYVR